MGHQTARKLTFVTTLAAAAIALMVAAGDGIALEATEIGPGPAGQGISPAIAGKGEGPWAKAGSTLRRVFAAHSAHQRAGGDAPFKPDNPSVQFAKGLILIDAVASGDGAALLEDLRGLGLKGGTQYGAVVSGRIPLGLLGRVVDLNSLRGVSASLKPETNSAVDPTFGLVHDRRAAIAMGLIATDADPQSYTGAGIKVGVLSDTFDNNGNPDYDGNGVGEPPATNADDDFANGDLPGGAGAFVALHAPGNVDDDDKSAFGAIGTSGSNATIDNTQFALDRDLPDPDGSIRFDPVTFNEDPVTAFVSYPDAPQYTLGGSAFTVEGWFKFATIGDGINEGPMLASQYATTGDQRGWWIVIGGPNEPDPLNTDQLIFAGTSDGTFNTFAATRYPFVPVPNVWYHIAVGRDSNDDMRAFVNGQQIGVAVNLPMDIYDSTAPLQIGNIDNLAGFNRPLDGWVEDFRFTVGEALYTSNFRPPGPLDSSLPPPPVPTATTTVIDDTASPGIDEGRAMAQLIHDIAPDASVSFHTAFNGIADFAQGIQDLADDGADIIVDDIIYFAEPMFQDGIVAQAVDNVVA